MDGRNAASQIASASRASFLALFTKGRTNLAWISRTSSPGSLDRRAQ